MDIHGSQESDYIQGSTSSASLFLIYIAKNILYASGRKSYKVN